MTVTRYEDKELLKYSDEGISEEHDDAVVPIKETT